MSKTLARGFIFAPLGSTTNVFFVICLAAYEWLNYVPYLLLLKMHPHRPLQVSRAHKKYITVIPLGGQGQHVSREDSI